MNFHATESHPFSHVTLASISSPPVSEFLTVDRVEYVPALPAGMAVELAVAYRVSLTAPSPVRDLSFDCLLSDVCEEGTLDGGESLIALSWSTKEGGCLMLGTEDGDALRSRMPWLNIEGGNYPVGNLPHGLRVAFAYIAPNTPVSFHFAIAYNSADNGDDSEWFAVDTPHAKVAEMAVLKRFSAKTK